MVLNANSIDEICTNLDKIAQIVEAKVKSSEICNEIQAKFDGKTALQGKKGLFVFSSNPLMAFSAKTLPGDILIKFGAKNVADGLQGDTPIINSEYILAQNPDFIAVVGSNVETFLQNNETLKNGKIVAAKMTILRGSQRIGESVDELYESLK